MEPPDRCDPRRAQPAWCRQSSLSAGRSIAGRPVRPTRRPAATRAHRRPSRPADGKVLSLNRSGCFAGSPGAAPDRMGAPLAVAIAGGATLLGIPAQVQHVAASVRHGAHAVGVRPGRVGPASPTRRNDHGSASSRAGCRGMRRPPASPRRGSASMMTCRGPDPTVLLGQTQGRAPSHPVVGASWLVLGVRSRGGLRRRAGPFRGRLHAVE